MSPPDPSTQAKLLESQADVDLILALRSGNTAALGALYDRHAGLVYGVALKVLNDPQEAEDLVHDIFLYLAREETYDSTRSSLRTFLAVLTRSRAIDRLRLRANRTRILQEREPGRPGDERDRLPLESLSQREQSQVVDEAIARLSESQQVVLKLMYYEGLSQSTISKQLNLPLSTVKGRARRGLLRLRQFFAADTGRLSP